ncbi:hypothetical protein [Microbacterium sp. p3-SID131]|jgi:hypothetical protein|uniref:hypothetical protein n=1 Tax=Microbacterium sp. p3-SID131 TaxID=2916215 RepID=UPI0021A89D31|nr:hypothetical protein [Microbacterium sp. p3-SID131]MCT1363962.1 hypothetical protein [Microbacterium sp. p3-SID131]
MAAAKKTAHRVAATMIVAKVPGAQGGEVYLRKGRILPSAVEASEIKRLTGLGLIEKFELDASEDDNQENAGGNAGGSN